MLGFVARSENSFSKFVSYAHVNLCHRFSSSWYQGLAATFACGSAYVFVTSVKNFHEFFTCVTNTFEFFTLVTYSFYFHIQTNLSHV